MKKTITLLMTIALTLALCCGAFAENYSVGVCQLMVCPLVCACSCAMASRHLCTQ